VRVDYTAGYSTIPADIERVALEMVQDAWTRRTSDNSVESESIGDYAVTYKAAEALTANPTWLSMLSPYVRFRP
jgi:hypothetical protein